MQRGELSNEELRRRVEALTGRSLSDVRRFTGGASSLTFFGSLEGEPEPEPIVIKVAPPGVAPTLNRDVLRQARILETLRGDSGVPVPAVLYQDLGTSMDIPPLFVMSRMPGEAIEPTTHPVSAEVPSAEEIAERQLAAACVLASLHARDITALGLDGEPALDLTTEVRRWIRIFETVPDDLRVGAEGVGQRLLDRVPAPEPSVLLHGDFRLGNVLCLKGAITAVIDWEIWGLGDRRIDVSWWLMNSHPTKQPQAVREPTGMPCTEELVGAYENAAGVSLTGLPWFHALSRFKAGAISALIMKYDGSRENPNPVVQDWNPRLPVQFTELAAEFLDEFA